MTLSDGTFLPKGTLVSAAMWATPHDEAVSPDADVFVPFRFARMRGAGEGEGTKHQFVHTSPEYIAFGHGKRAWYVFRVFWLDQLHKTD